MSDFHLPRRTRRLLAQLAPAVCPPDIVELGLVEPVVDHVELSMSSFPAPLRAALIAGLAAFELSARVRREAPGAHFDRWWRGAGPFHALAKGLKALLALAYYEHPTVRDRMAYRPEAWIADVARRRLNAWAEAIAAHERLVVAADPLVRIGKVNHEEAA